MANQLLRLFCSNIALIIVVIWFAIFSQSDFILICYDICFQIAILNFFYYLFIFFFNFSDGFVNFGTSAWHRASKRASVRERRLRRKLSVTHLLRQLLKHCLINQFGQVVLLNCVFDNMKHFSSVSLPIAKPSNVSYYKIFA